MNTYIGNTYYLVRVYYDYKCTTSPNLYDPIKNEYLNTTRGELLLPLIQTECSILEWLIKNNVFANSNFIKLMIINYLQVDYSTYSNNLKFMGKDYQLVNNYFTYQYVVQDYLSKLITYYTPQYNSTLMKI
jgi:hypothetical protein